MTAPRDDHSDLSELEFQLTAGLGWRAIGGRLPVGVTENLLNHDNTPDIAVHLSYGRQLGTASTPRRRAVGPP